MNQSTTTQSVIEQTAQNVEEIFNGFSDEIPSNNEPIEVVVETQPKASTQQVKEAKKYINNLLGYIQSDKFKEDINKTAAEYQVPPKALAKNFFEKALGTVGDVLGITISSVGNIASMVVDVLSAILHGAIDILVKVANALARTITLNKTCTVR